MPELRLKVQLGDDKVASSSSQDVKPFKKFLYLVNSPSTTSIEELIDKLQEYIARRFSFTRTRIVELMTNDGFTLSRFDLCSAVLKDNEHVVCIDMLKFRENYYSTFKGHQLWLELQQHDASDNRDKFLKIGINFYSELFIEARGTTSVISFQLFNIQDLAKIADEKNSANLITRIDNSYDYNPSSADDWFIESRWEYDIESNRNLFIVSSLKVTSEDKIYYAKLQIILDEVQHRLYKGEVTCFSKDDGDSAANDYQQSHLKEIIAKLPAARRSGPEINLDGREELKVTRHECEGESSIRMTNGNSNRVLVYQNLATFDGSTFSQDINITNIIFSKKPTVLPEIFQQKRSAPVDKPVAVSQLTVLYQHYDGSWRDCQDIAIAPVPLPNEPPQWLNDPVINIEPDKLISFTIKGRIEVRGQPSKDAIIQERSHKSLPQPLRLKILVIDNLGKKCSLVVEQLNPPLPLNTCDSFLKRNQTSIMELISFVYADDCENEERICVAMYISTEGRLVIKNYDSSYATFDRKALRKLEFDAKQTKSTEVSMKGAMFRHYSQESKATALLDQEKYRIYAIRLEVSTKTSRTEETVHISMEKIK